MQLAVKIFTMPVYWKLSVPRSQTMWLAPLRKHKLLFINFVINTDWALIWESILAWRGRIILFFFFRQGN